MRRVGLIAASLFAFASLAQAEPIFRMDLSAPVIFTSETPDGGTSSPGTTVSLADRAPIPWENLQHQEFDFSSLLTVTPPGASTPAWGIDSTSPGYDLPSGLVFSEGVLSGTATDAPDEYSFSVSATVSGVMDSHVYTVSLSDAMDEDASDLIAAMTVEPDQGRIDLIDQTVVALKQAGVWSKLDLLYVPAAHDRQAAALNWLEPTAHPLTEVGTIGFGEDIGLRADGPSSYLTTSWSAGVSGAYFAQNAASMGGKLHGTPRAGTTLSQIAAIAGNGGYPSTLRYRTGSTDDLQAGLNGNFFPSVGSGFSDSAIPVAIVRSSASDLFYYRAGNQVATVSSPSAGKSLDYPRFIADGNGYTQQELQYVFIGGALTSGEISAITSILGAYLAGL